MLAVHSGPQGSCCNPVLTGLSWADVWPFTSYKTLVLVALWTALDNVCGGKLLVFNSLQQAAVILELASDSLWYKHSFISVVSVAAGGGMETVISWCEAHSRLLREP